MARGKQVAVGIAAGIVILALSPFVASYVLTNVPAIQRKAQITKSADNLRALAQMWVSPTHPAHPAIGKRFVLAVARSGTDLHTGRNAEVLFSPADTTRSVERAGGASAFPALTPERIADPAFDPGPFTSYVGSAGTGDRAIFADLSFGDVAIVAFSDATVRTLTKSDLGLAPNDPLVAGPTSKSPLLRTLSDR